MEGDLRDWEVLDSSSGSATEDNSKTLDEGTQGLIRFDHFSLETSNNGVDDEVSEDGSAQSGSPGWIEPRSDAPYGPKHLSELWSDSSSDRVDDDVGFVGQGQESPSLPIDPSGGGGKGEEAKGMVWWKIPIELLKYCLFKVNPVWSFSMAAAFVGFVMLGRRLYNMKKKTRTLHLKLLLDDKKVANQSARLNEAISIVKRVPIIRPALPSSVGMNQWSMMRA